MTMTDTNSEQAVHCADAIRDFEADRAAWDGTGRLQPARLGEDGTTEVLLPEGVANARPGVIQVTQLTRAEGTDAVQEARLLATSEEFPFIVYVSDVLGLPSALPERLRSNCLYAQVGRLPEPVPFAEGDNRRAVWDLALFIEDDTATDDANSPFAPIPNADMFPAFERRTLVLPQGGRRQGWIWRGLATRSTSGSPVAFEHLAAHPELDDALLGEYVVPRTGQIAVPLYRKDDGMLACVTGYGNGTTPGAAFEDLAEFSMSRVRREGLSRKAQVLLSKAYSMADEKFLRADRARDAAEAEARANREHHEHDMEVISTALAEKADERGLCGEYEEVIEAVSEDMFIAIEGRRKTFTVDVRVTYDVSIEVTARNSAEARERLDMGEVTDEIDRNGTANYEDYDIIDVEETEG